MFVLLRAYDLRTEENCLSELPWAIADTGSASEIESSGPHSLFRVVVLSEGICSVGVLVVV